MVRKNSKKSVFTILILIVIFSIIASNYGSFFSLIPPPCSGGQVLSIDDVSIVKNPPDSEIESDNVLRVLMSTIETAECLTINLEEQDLESEIEDFDAFGDLILDIDLTKSDKIFDIDQTGDPFQQLVDVNIGDVFLCTDDKCEEEFASMGIQEEVTASVRESFISDCHCFWNSLLGEGAEFGSTELIEWETEISIPGIGTAVLNNQNPTEHIGDVAFVKWAGNLDAPASLSKPDKDAFFPVDLPGTDFRMIPDGTYGDFYEGYPSDYDDIRDRIIECGGIPGGTMECDEAIEDAIIFGVTIRNKLEDQLEQWIEDTEWVGDAEWEDDKLIAHLTTPTQYPIFTLDIDALEVGIYITGGIPEVTCPSDLEIPVGDIEISKVFNLKNIDEEQSGSFNYYIDCEDGYAQFSIQPPLSFDPGQSRNLVATLSLVVEEGDQTVDCTFFAEDINFGTSDDCDFELTGHETPGGCISLVGIEGKTCQGGDVWTCKEDGNWEITECEFGCSELGGEAECKQEEPSGEGGFLDKIKSFFTDLFSGAIGTLMIIQYIIVFGLGIVSIFITQDILSGIRGLKGKNKKTARWIISIGFGIGIGFALNSFIFSSTFWILSVIGVLFILFGGTIKKFFNR